MKGIPPDLKHDEQDKGKLTARVVEFLIRMGLYPVVGLWIDVCYPYHSVT